MLAPLKIIGRSLLRHMKLIWERLRSIFSTLSTTKGSSPNKISVSYHNANVIAASESQEEILHSNSSSTAMNDGTISEVIPASSPNLGAEPHSNTLVVGSQSGSVNSDDNSGDSDTASYDLEVEPPTPCLSPEVSQSASTQWQLDNIF